MVPGLFYLVAFVGFCLFWVFLTTMLFCFDIGSSGVCTVGCSTITEVLKEDLCSPVSLYHGSSLTVSMPAIKPTLNLNLCLDLDLLNV